LADREAEANGSQALPGGLVIHSLIGREVPPSRHCVELYCAPQCGQVAPVRNISNALPHLPHKVNASVAGRATELVCFRRNEPLAAALAVGSFVSCNRLNTAAPSGKVF